jgi:hypothetical protein
MMAFVLPLVLASTHCAKMPCATGVNFTATVEPSEFVLIDQQRVGPGAWRMTAQSSRAKREWLVLVDGPVPFVEVTVAIDGRLEMGQLESVIALDWPERPRDLRKALAQYRRRMKRWTN